ncbi:Retrovirus-related Pol polyprotein from type-1 retrotransposable element R2 [Anabarilius grahami]|uniref:Retrovirus-related Pol polyprotein from type-1 retrotransposable element R2 n=1 Tax=Anabarilius grahami TaxID=495550 RepID=A0A3N0XJW5_ANAGA|nr:Retrovirus-related Pol polyprotein from type-1 retrotransposable element R2 [Anabarilius grahami]
MQSEQEVTEPVVRPHTQRERYPPAYLNDYDVVYQPSQIPAASADASSIMPVATCPAAQPDDETVPCRPPSAQSSASSRYSHSRTKTSRSSGSSRTTASRLTDLQAAIVARLALYEREDLLREQQRRSRQLDEEVRAAHKTKELITKQLERQRRIKQKEMELEKARLIASLLRESETGNATAVPQTRSELDPGQVSQVQIQQGPAMPSHLPLQSQYNPNLILQQVSYIYLKKATECWRDYFKKISTQEFPHSPIVHTPPVLGPVQPVTADEVIEVVKKMKPGKATGPDNLAAEVWKSQCWNSIEMASTFVQPGHFREEDACRLAVTSPQAGFVNAIHATQLLFEKHRENQKPLHADFLNLEKAFNRVLHETIWHALRTHDVPEELMELVKLLYEEPKSRVQSTARTRKEFHITEAIHQRSVLSPLLFSLVMDIVTQDLQQPVQWTLFYAEDVMLAAEEKVRLEQAWSNRLATFSLHLNVKKMEYMTDVNEHGKVTKFGTLCCTQVMAHKNSDDFITLLRGTCVYFSQ